MNDPDPNAPASATTTSDLGTLALAAAIAAPVLLAGCGSAGGGGASGDTSPTLTLTAIEVRAERSTTDVVTVNLVAQPDSGAGVAFTAADPGKAANPRSWSFLAHVAGGTTDHDLTVTINPSLSTVRGMPLPLYGTTFAQARHIAARTGFGASLDDLMAMIGIDYDTVIDTLVDNLRTTPVQAAPDWINDTILTWTEFSSMSKANQDAYNDRKYPRRLALKEWWLREITMTASPLTERLLAFWGNHFVVNIDDIEEPQLAWSWMTLLRTHLGGDLRAFVHAMALHPAMLLYLDNASNVAVRPPGTSSPTPKNLPSNENFGRELLELFTLGEGRGYSEADVIGVARAFTGHNLDDRKAYLFKSGSHDISTDMPILGATGQFNGPQAIERIFLVQDAGIPRMARFIVEKLWVEFISSDLTAHAGAVTTLATAFAADFDLSELYKKLFKRQEFKDGATSEAAKLLKSPLEHIAGFFRSMGLPAFDGRWDSRVYEAGGEDQDPLAPPNVKGWLGGTSWINAKTLLERFGHDSNYGWILSDLKRFSDAQLPQHLYDGYEVFFLATTRVFPAPTLDTWERPFATHMRALLRDPAYQLK